jgi:hypothetical protein
MQRSGNLFIVFTEDDGSGIVVQDATFDGATHNTLVDAPPYKDDQQLHGVYNSFWAGVYSDQDGTLDIQFSYDGTDWFETGTSTDAGANTYQAINVAGVFLFPYVRAIWTSTGDNDTTFFNFWSALSTI